MDNELKQEFSAIKRSLGKIITTQNEHTVAIEVIKERRISDRESLTGIRERTEKLEKKTNRMPYLTVGVMTLVLSIITFFEKIKGIFK